MPVQLNVNELRELARNYGPSAINEHMKNLKDAMDEGMGKVKNEWIDMLDSDWKSPRAGSWDVRVKEAEMRNGNLVGAVVLNHDWAEVLSGGKSVPPRSADDGEWMRIPISAKKGDPVNVPDRFISDDGQYMFVKQVSGYKGENHLPVLRQLGEHVIRNDIQLAVSKIRDKLRS